MYVPDSSDSDERPCRWLLKIIWAFHSKQVSVGTEAIVLGLALMCWVPLQSLQTGATKTHSKDRLSAHQGVHKTTRGYLDVHHWRLSWQNEDQHER